MDQLLRVSTMRLRYFQFALKEKIKRKILNEKLVTWHFFLFFGNRVTQRIVLAYQLSATIAAYGAASSNWTVACGAMRSRGGVASLLAELDGLWC